jgi:4-amino-4-deoxy-L-arabinose transferase-like glycosyltransferase
MMTTHDRRTPRRLIARAPYIILLLALALRVRGLDARPLWYDEAFAVLFSEKGFAAMLKGTLTPVEGAAADVHPVAYYTALNGWMQALGQTPFAVRMLSVFLGMLTLAAVYAIGRMLFHPRAARVGMLIAALSPFQVYYDRETRMYAGLALFCALTVVCVARAARLERQAGPNARTLSHWGAWAGVSLFAALAMYMQNLAAFFLLALGLSALARPRVFARMAVAGAGAFVLWLPWFLNLGSQLAKLQKSYWVTRPTPLTLLQTALVYHTGEEMLEARLLLPLALFTGLVLPLMLAFQLFKARRAPETRPAAWLAALAAGTPLLLFVASLYQPVYIQRALLPAAAMYSVALGWLLTTRSAPGVIRGGLGLLLAATSITGLWAHFTFAQFPRPHFPAVVHWLRQHAGPDDRIVHSNKLTFLPMHYYDRALPQTFVADPAGLGSDTLAFPTQAVLGLYPAADIEAAAAGAGRVWFVIFDRAVAELAPGPHPHLHWLDEHFRQQQKLQFDDMAVYEYVSARSGF